MGLISVLSLSRCFTSLMCLVIVFTGSCESHYNSESHHSGHTHKRPASGSVLNQGSFYDKQHIIEDVKDSYRIDINADSITDDDVQFYYFHTHDLDKNGKLDGLEILHAMNHILDQAEDPEAGTSTTSKPDPEKDGPIEEFYRMRNQMKWNNKFAEDAELIDNILDRFDLDQNGFLSWDEYVVASKTAL